MTKIFTCTSDAPYNRHDYEIVLKNKKRVRFDTWEEAQLYWFQHCKIPDFLNVLNVRNKTSPAGFKA